MERTTIDVSQRDWHRYFRTSYKGTSGAVTRAIAAELASFADWDTGAEVRPGLARIAEALGLGISTVERHVSRLIQDGWLRKVSHGGRYTASIYQLTTPLPSVERVVDTSTPLAASDGVEATPLAGEVNSPRHTTATPLAALGDHHSPRTIPKDLDAGVTPLIESDTEPETEELTPYWADVRARRLEALRRRHNATR